MKAKKYSNPVIFIHHLDTFPYGEVNEVQFYLGDVDITRELACILDVYWKRWCYDTDGIGYDLLTRAALVQTGESFTEEDFAACVEDVISLPVVTKKYRKPRRRKT